MGEGDGICMRVYIGVGGMKVWVISKTRITLRGRGGRGDEGVICIRVQGGVNESLCDKLNQFLSESKREFLCNIL